MYTDLQSNQSPHDFKCLAPKKYQDKPKTNAEPDTRPKHQSLSKTMRPEHKRMSRVLGYCLTLADADSWASFSALAAARLSAEERGALALAALMSLDCSEQAVAVAETALSHAGSPLPPFLSPMDDARWWASFASLNERKAYALAAYEALPLKEQMAFRRHISEMEIAA
ncbi:hypothetical protein [Leisingera sp. HS039]|uniref:hypothetical protein n=1 Tax=Leisingera sp. HS039 TaxID=2818496 RepID=UPI001B3A742B|nr:hypothetical protein [Leisingera sp. HS039]